MNRDLYNFHNRSLATNSAASGSSTSPALSLTEPLASLGNPRSSQYYHSWNDGCCFWPFGRYQFRHSRESNLGTTHTSTVLTALHRGNNPAPFSVKGGVIAITRPLLANSAVHSCDSVLVGSHGNFSALELRYPFVLPSRQQGLPSSSYLLSSSAVFPLRPVSQLTPINVDRFQHEVRQSCTRGPDLRAGFHLGFNYSTPLSRRQGIWPLHS